MVCSNHVTGCSERGSAFNLNVPLPGADPAKFTLNCVPHPRWIRRVTRFDRVEFPAGDSAKPIRHNRLPGIGCPQFSSEATPGALDVLLFSFGIARGGRARCNNRRFAGATLHRLLSGARRRP